MNKNMNKRGFAIHMIILILAILIGFGTFFYHYALNENPVSGDSIGDVQLNIIKNFQNAEKSLFYIDQSAKYANQQSIYDLSKQGGHYESPCGTFSDVSVWAVIERDGDKTTTKECYPSTDIIKKSYIGIFNDRLGEYIANYPDTHIPPTYNYEINDKLELIGKATDNIVIEITPKGYEFKAEPVKGTPSDIYQKAATSEIGKPLLVPMSKRDGKVDIETIQKYHPEVWSQYLELCKRMGASPGVYTYRPTPCSVTSGYRDPYYNQKKEGARDSSHLYGLALDIHVSSDIKEQLRWAKEASKLFTRVAIYPGQTNIHVDMIPLKGQYAAPFMINSRGKTQERAYSIAELENKATKYT